MATIELRGRINDDGELEVKLPEGLPRGEVKVTIEVAAEDHESRAPRRSLYGLWANVGIDVSEGDIDEIRREMWSNFPREDIVE
jgi:hypothetical protein